MNSYKLIRLLISIFSFAYKQIFRFVISKRKDAHKQTNNSLHTNGVIYAMNLHTFTTPFIALLKFSSMNLCQSTCFSLNSGTVNHLNRASSLKISKENYMQIRVM